VASLRSQSSSSSQSNAACIASSVVQLDCQSLLALAFSTATIPDQAKGCIKGALIGGTAGHFAGHHGLLGAAAGCVIGRHEANRQRQLKLRQQNSQPGTAYYR
jgi:hypothetical protein